MDKLYTLCEKIDGIKFDYRSTLQQDKYEIKKIINEVYNKYKDMLATTNTFYEMLLDVQVNLQRIGYTYTYELYERTLSVTIEGIVLKC